MTYLLIVLEPLGSDLGDGVILVRLASGNASKLHRIAIAQRAEKLRVNSLLKASSLLYLNLILTCKFAYLAWFHHGHQGAGSCDIW